MESGSGHRDVGRLMSFRAEMRRRAAFDESRGTAKTSITRELEGHDAHGTCLPR